jgi:acetyl-CoA carboxylase carboxyl transferase subunit alpha
MSTFLEFEQPIQLVVEQIEKLNEVAADGEVDVKAAMKDLEKKLTEARKQVYGKLSPWQRVQVSRHPERPYTMRYINYMTGGSFIELHGDRTVKDDKAMVGGFGLMDGRTVMFIGQQKGVNTKMRQFRNFGMPNPEGYRKALRLMKLAEKFNKPVVTLIDTPGAFPGLEAEERGTRRSHSPEFAGNVPIESAHYLCGGGGGSIRRSIRHWCRRPGTDDGE